MNTDSSLKRHALGLLVGLAVQYLLGMAINVYVQFPNNESAGQLWEFSWHQPLVAVHIVLAILLFTGSLALAIKAQKAKDTNMRLPAWIGFIAIFAAGFMGSRFIPTQQDPYSYGMAVCFLIAFAALCWGLYRAK